MEAALSARSASLGTFDLVEDVRNHLFLDHKADPQPRQRGFSASASANWNELEQGEAPRLTSSTRARIAS